MDAVRRAGGHPTERQIWGTEYLSTAIDGLGFARVSSAIRYYSTVRPLLHSIINASANKLILFCIMAWPKLDTVSFTVEKDFDVESTTSAGREQWPIMSVPIHATYSWG